MASPGALTTQRLRGAGIDTHTFGAVIEREHDPPTGAYCPERKMARQQDDNGYWGCPTALCRPIYGYYASTMYNGPGECSPSYFLALKERAQLGWRGEDRR